MSDTSINVGAEAPVEIPATLCEKSNKTTSIGKQWARAGVTEVTRCVVGKKRDPIIGEALHEIFQDQKLKPQTPCPASRAWSLRLNAFWLKEAGNRGAEIEGFWTKPRAVLR
jgi:hypothetical protein